VRGSGYESWFVSARDPVSRRALWIRRTSHRPAHGPESAALWCTVADPDAGQPPTVIKEVFDVLPPATAAGPGRFRGHAALGPLSARWDLAITTGEPPLRSLRPALLYAAPLPRTKLVAEVPDGQVSGQVEIRDRLMTVSGWRATVGRNWGTEHADSWVWLHAGFGESPGTWLDLVLARVRVGPARLPWTAMGALSLDGTRTLLGGLGRRTVVAAGPDRLAADVPGSGGRARISVTAGGGDPVVVTYSDPGGGTRTVVHAGLAAVEVIFGRPGAPETVLRADRCAYEYGTSDPVAGLTPRPLPVG
jgi:hypothetical protein